MPLRPEADAPYSSTVMLTQLTGCYTGRIEIMGKQIWRRKTLHFGRAGFPPALSF